MMQQQQQQQVAAGTFVVTDPVVRGGGLRAPQGYAPYVAAGVDSTRSWNSSGGSNVADGSSSSSGFGGFARNMRGATAAATQQEQLDAAARARQGLDSADALALGPRLMSLGPARARDPRMQGLEVPELDDEPDLDTAALLLLPTALAPTTGQDGWLMGAQRAPAGAYNAQVALESQLQNRGLVALQRGLQAAWAPPSSSTLMQQQRNGDPAATAAPGAVAPGDLVSPHAQWTRMYAPPDNARAFNQPVCARSSR